jgi:hypothetical protein
MISKLETVLDEQGVKDFFRALSANLQEIFASDYYNDVEQLQEDFQDWKMSDLKDYRDTLNEILQEIAPDGIELTWRDCTKAVVKNRWKLCRCCGQPFLTYDKKNRMGFCYSTDYRRYKVGKGEYYKLAQKGVSTCQAKYLSTRSRSSNNNSFEYVKPF